VRTSSLSSLDSQGVLCVFIANVSCRTQSKDFFSDVVRECAGDQSKAICLSTMGHMRGCDAACCTTQPRQRSGPTYRHSACQTSTHADTWPTPDDWCLRRREICERQEGRGQKFPESVDELARILESEFAAARRIRDNQRLRTSLIRS
jgi:hypothetical protein